MKEFEVEGVMKEVENIEGAHGILVYIGDSDTDDEGYIVYASVYDNLDNCHDIKVYRTSDEDDAVQSAELITEKLAEVYSDTMLGI